MAGWGGFTEEDLLALKESVPRSVHPGGNSHDIEFIDSRLKHKGKAATTLEGIGKSKKKPRERLLRISAAKQSTSPDSSMTVNPVKSDSEGSTAKPIKGIDIVSVSHIVTPAAVQTVGLETAIIKDQMPTLDNSRKCEHTKVEENTLRSSNIKSNKENYESENLQKEENKPSSNIIMFPPDKELATPQLSLLDQLQLKQKQVEEENKKRKKIIKEAIQERYSKAQNEALVLQDVQKELSHLDHILAKDVEIIRTKIEEATMAFSQAQSRYKTAEEEFVQAKLDIHVKEETKDMLTQHLYTIIQENELRKAKKLEELMGKLNLSQEKNKL